MEYANAKIISRVLFAMKKYFAPIVAVMLMMVNVMTEVRILITTSVDAELIAVTVAPGMEMTADLVLTVN
jgi:hypothetical protein